MAPSQRFPVGSVAESLRRHQRQLLAPEPKAELGGLEAQLVFAACAVSSSTGCGAVRYQGFSCYNTKGSARLASAEVRRKCVMLTVYFSLIGFRPSL